MIKTMGLGTAALAVPSVLAGCSSTSGGRTSIRLEETKPEVIPYFDSLVAKFNASQKSVSVTHDSASSLIAEFVRGNPPDIVDVAHELAKNLTEPLESPPVQGDITDGSLPPGSHPLWDRDEVHDIYAEWRPVFNEYDPPRSAVAEAWVHPSRRPRYASPDGLGQAFNFDLLNANWSSGSSCG